MKIYQHVTLSEDPSSAMDAVTKQYVDNAVNQGTSSVVVGGLFITDVIPTNTGIVGSKAYVANTVPADAVLSSATSDNQNVRVKILAEGGSAFFSPTVTINGVTATLNQNQTNERFFTGYADIVLPAGTSTVTASSSTGASASVQMTLAGPGPVFTSLTIGTLPNSQTEVKQGDVVPVSGVVENAAISAQILASGASGSVSALTLGAADSAGTGYKTVTGTFTVGSGSGSMTVQANAKNSFGTVGATFGSSNSVTLDQVHPSITGISVTYPTGQQAIKGTEAATVNATITNFDTVQYTSSSDLTVDTPTTYATGKTVTRIAGTDGYVYGVNNYTITATKASNGAVTTANAQVAIADAAPTASISIDGNPARLISSPNGQTYTVRVTPSQKLLSAPTLSDSIGTLSSPFTQSTGLTWIATITIKDTDPKGTGVFSSLGLTGLANNLGSSITSGANYTVGGFTERSITFAAFSQIAAIGTNVATMSKTDAQYSGTATNLTLVYDTGNYFKSYTIVDSNGNEDATGGYLWLNDQSFAQSNTSGTLIVNIEETA